MADDSVGKISLNLELNGSDLEKQMKVLADGMQNALQGSLQNTLSFFSKSLDSFIKDTTTKMNTTMRDALQEVVSGKGKTPSTNPAPPSLSETAKPGGAAVITPKVNLAPAREQIIDISKRLTAFAQQGLQSTVTGLGNMTNFAKRSFDGIGTRIKSFAQTGTGASAAVSQSTEEIKAKIESLTAQMDNASNRAEYYSQKLKELRASYEGLSPRSKDSDYGKGLLGDLLKTEEAMLRYGARSDKLRLDIEKLENSMLKTGEVAKKAGGLFGRVGVAIGRVGGVFGRVGSAIAKVGGFFRHTGNAAKEAGGASGKAGNLFERAGKQGNSFATGIQRALTRVLKQVFVFSILYKGIRAMIDYMNSALKTNRQFTTSMNQIKTNLAVAFQPIYNFILPAINSLVRALASATAYVAAFFSALSGKTYKENYAAAKSLESAKKNMEGYGKASKDTKGALAGFDEINQLDIQDDSGSDTGGFQMTQPEVIPEVTEKASAFKDIFSDVFEPFQKAWKTQGQKTIDSMKKALGGVKELFGEIGKSFREVWTNGTGQKILETAYKTLQNIFELIGDIGKDFATAWKEGNVGTRIIQGLYNTANSLWEIIERVTGSAKKMWGEIGPAVSKTVLNVIDSTVKIFEKLGEKLLWVWDHGGQKLFENLIRLGAKIFELAGGIYTEFVAPFVMWFMDMIAPAVAWVLDKINWFVEKAIEFFEWLYDVLIGHSIIPDLINSIVQWFKDMVDWVLTPVKNLIESIKEKWEAVKTFFGELWEGIKQTFIDKWNEIVEWWNNSAIAKWWDENVAPWFTIEKWKELFSNIWTGLKGVWGDIRTWWSNTAIAKWWSEDVAPWFSLKTWGELFENIKKAFADGWESVKQTAKDVWKSIINAIIERINKLIERVNTMKFTAPDFLGGKSWSPNIRPITPLARGGIIDQPTLAMIGERGKKEAVVPLENTSFVDTLASAVGTAVLTAMQMNSNNKSQGTGGTVEAVLAVDGVKLGRVLIPIIDDQRKRIGGTVIQPI